MQLKLDQQDRLSRGLFQDQQEFSIKLDCAILAYEK
jgi:hypothetical protein